MGTTAEGEKLLEAKLDSVLIKTIKGKKLRVPVNFKEQKETLPWAA